MGLAQRVGCWGRRRRSRGRRRCYDYIYLGSAGVTPSSLSALPQVQLGRAELHMGVPRQRGYCLPRGAAPAVQPARRREPVARAASPLSNRRPRPAPVVPSSVRLSPFQTRARRARPAPGATRGCPCHRRPVLPAASAVWPRRSSILLTAPRRLAVRCGGGARRRRLPDGRRAQLRCARPPPSAVSSLCFPALPPSGDRGSWRRRLSPAAARASCSSLSILLLLKPRPKTADTGRQRVAL